jgi:hypothetical protein
VAIEIDVYTRLDANEIQRSADAMRRDLEQAGDRGGEALERGLGRGLNKVEIATNKARVEQEKYTQELTAYNSAVSSGNADRTRLIEQFERMSKAQDDARRSLRQVRDDMRGLGDGADAATSSFSELGSTMAGIGRIVTPAGIAALGPALVTVAGVAASASQALLLIPAAATAAGAAFGTLKLATMGFSEALDAMGDPEKFAEGLKALAPNAQQAVLAIQNLMPAFKGLQQATQDSLFAGVGEQLNQLSSQYLPTIRNMTTGIATSFNQMFSSLGNQLMTPQMQANIKAITDNIASAFHELVPAIAPLTRAFADLMATGSDFLPDIARGAADAAEAFSAFIHEARQSGELHNWLSNGLSTLGQLGDIAFDVGRAFLSLADTGQRELPRITQAVDDLADSMGALVKVMSVVGHVAQLIYNPLEGVRGLAADFGIIDQPAAAPGPSGSGASGGPSALDNLLAGISPTGSTGALGIPGFPGGGFALPAGAAGGIGNSAIGTTYAPSRWSAGASNPFASTSSGGSGKDATPFIDPSQYMMGDPLAGLPGAVAGSDPNAIYAADSKVITATHNLEQGKLALAVLQAKGNATQQEFLTAKNNLVEQERALYDAQADDIKTRTNQMKQSVDDLSSIFAPLDQDFGLSRGIPGFVENLVKMFGNIALAGAIGSSPTLQTAALSLMADQSASGQATGASPLAQYGIPGVSQMGPTALQPGMAAATSTSPGWMPTAGPRAGGDYGLAAGTNTGGYGSGGKGIFPDWVQQLGDAFGVKPSTYAGHQETDRHEAGFAPNPSHENRGIDWSGPVANMQKFSDYLATIPQDLEQVIWRNPNTGQTDTIAGGRPVSGYYDAGTLAEHENHVHTRQSSPIPLPGASAPMTWATPGLPSGITGGGGQGPIFGFDQGPGVGGGAGIGGGTADPFAPGGALSAIPNIGPGPLQVGPPGGSIGGAPGQIGPFPTLPGMGPKPPGGVGAGAGLAGPVGGPPPMTTGTPFPGGTPGGGAVGGAALDMATDAGAMALDVMAPGAGEAAKIGIQLAKRAVQFGAQAAGIGVSGLMETFLPAGSPLAGNSWFSKLAGGLSGARPAKDNLAGKQTAQAPPVGSPASGQGSGPAPGPGNTFNTTVNNSRATEDGTGRDIQQHLSAQYAMPGPG